MFCRTWKQILRQVLSLLSSASSSACFCFVCVCCRLLPVCHFTQRCAIFPISKHCWRRRRPETMCSSSLNIQNCYELFLLIIIILFVCWLWLWFEDIEHRHSLHCCVTFLLTQYHINKWYFVVSLEFNRGCWKFDADIEIVMMQFLSIDPLLWTFNYSIWNNLTI